MASEFTLSNEFNMLNLKEQSLKCYSPKLTLYSDLIWTAYVVKKSKELWVGLDYFKTPQMQTLSIEALCEVQIIANNFTASYLHKEFKYQSFEKQDENQNLWNATNFRVLKNATFSGIFKVMISIRIPYCFIVWRLPEKSVEKKDRSRDKAVKIDFRQKVLQALLENVKESTQPRPSREERLNESISFTTPKAPRAPETKKPFKVLPKTLKCPMCIEDDVEVSIPCGHEFCFSCIRREPKCPTCVELDYGMELTITRSYKNMAERMRKLLDE